MKYRLIALILALTTACWAQTPAPAQSATSEKSSDTQCARCDKTASASTSASAEHKHACMHVKSAAKDGKEVVSCCSAKDAASCCQGKDGKACAKMMENASASCGEKCAAGCEKDCYLDKDARKRRTIATAANVLTKNPCKQRPETNIPS